MKSKFVKEEVKVDKVLRVASKVWKLLMKKTKNPFEGYAVLRFLCVFLEAELDVKFVPSDEVKLYELVNRIRSDEGF